MVNAAGVFDLVLAVLSRTLGNRPLLGIAGWYGSTSDLHSNGQLGWRCRSRRAPTLVNYVGNSRSTGWQSAVAIAMLRDATESTELITSFAPATSTMSERDSPRTRNKGHEQQHTTKPHQARLEILLGLLEATTHPHEAAAPHRRVVARSSSQVVGAMPATSCFMREQSIPNQSR